MVIVEYCKYGNLSNYLKSKRNFFCPNKVRRQMPLVRFILRNLSVDNVDVSLWASLLRFSSTKGGKQLLGTVHLTCFNIWCGMCYAKKGLISLPWLCKETAVIQVEPSTVRGSESYPKCPHMLSPCCWQTHSWWAWGHFRGWCERSRRKWFCPLISVLLGTQLR